ncbi:hypothetical protein MFLAVUS_009501 [Mucor flavus]|uniref:Uncharacterized protein n=1 Tax=Mucor flavus TaxID=439312 RepID=A0ABP9ZA76_9FUNG
MYLITGKIIFENGQGNIVDENGNEAMWTGKKKSIPLEKTINASTISKNKYADYSDSQKTVFVYYLQLKFLSASAAARKAAINVRTGQDWAKKLKDDPDWDIFEKKPTNFFYDNPHARVSDAIEELTKNFEGFTLKETVVGKFISIKSNLSIKTITRHPVARNQTAKIKERREWVETWSKTDMNYTENCIFIGESAFDVNMKSPTARSIRGTPAIVTSPSARAISHTILGAISTCGVVNMEIRVPLTPKRIRVVGAPKRKATAAKSKTP